MAFPSTVLDGIRTGTIGGAAVGSLVSVVREHSVATGLALGRGEGAAAHLLIETDGVPYVYDIAAMGNVRAIHADARERLVLSVGDNEVDAHRLPNYIGSLALIAEGLVVCASGGTDGFRRPTQALVSLAAFQVLETNYQRFVDAVWFTNWSLSARDATDKLVRLIGNPAWPEAFRLQR